MIPAVTAFWAGLPAPVRKALTWIGIGILIFFLGKAYVIAKQNEAVVKQKAKDAEQTRKTLNTIEDKSDARIEQAEAIRANNPVTGDPDRMSDRPLADYHYRD